MDERQQAPVGTWIASGIELLKTHSAGFFDALSDGVRFVIDGMTTPLVWLPKPLLILLVAALAYALRRSSQLTLFVTLALLFIRWTFRDC